MRALPEKNSINTVWWKKVFTFKMLIIFALGFSSGLPLLLTGSTLKLWLAQEHIDIKTIGFFGWVGLAYSFKFLWSPFLDRYFSNKLGRRKTWMLFSQIGMIFGLIMMGLQNPVDNLWGLAVWSVFVAFMSATQDIAIDAYRREFLSNEELGLGSSMNVYGYRVAMLVAGGIGISLVADAAMSSATATATATSAGFLTWNQLYFLMSAILAGITVLTIFIPEPRDINTPATLLSAVIDPFIEFFKRKEGIAILIFVFLFKLGDQISGSLLNPFYKDMGYQNLEIGLITKTYGMISSLLGLFIGGVAMLKFGIKKSLWIFGILQAVSTALFALITITGPTLLALGVVVIFEDMTSGMATAAFTAFIAAVTNKKFTATQFAALTSVATLGRTFFSGFAGVIQSAVGWAWFFYIGAILAIPGLILLWWLSRRHSTFSATESRT